jgi:hypothetical protein
MSRSRDHARLNTGVASRGTEVHDAKTQIIRHDKYTGSSFSPVPINLMAAQAVLVPAIQTSR